MESRKTTPATLPKVVFASAEQRMLNSIRLMFGHRCALFLVSDAQAARDILIQHDIDVIVSDHQMPQLNGVELLATVRLISPRATRILLADNAGFNAVETSIDELGVFRLLTKPCASDALRAAIDLAVKVAQRDAVSPPATPIDPEQQLVHDILSQESPDLPPSPAAEILDDWSRTMTEQELSETDVIEQPELAAVTPIQERQLEHKPAPASENGVVVFSLDDNVVDSIRHAARNRFTLHVAANIVHVVKILREDRPGVLVTDITQNRGDVQSMVAQLKLYVPELVTIIASESGDSPDIVWLINHGDVFRFLSKPVSPGRCAVSIRAALQHHETLRSLARQSQAAIDPDENAGGFSGAFEKLKSVRRLWA